MFLAISTTILIDKYYTMQIEHNNPYLPY